MSSEFPSASDDRLALIADRDDTTRRIFASVLEDHTWRSDQAEDGREALAKSMAQLPRVVITDTQLPGISGYDLCTLLHNDPLTDGIAVILTMNSPMPATVERAREVGADAVLIKTCASQLFPTIEQLAHRSESIVQRSRMLSERSEIVRGRSSAQVARAAATVEYARTVRQTVKRMTLKGSLRRGDTTTPPLPPPALVCPACDRALTYQRSQIGGVNERLIEQWDYFVCPGGCGIFQYRNRTRKLKKVS